MLERGLARCRGEICRIAAGGTDDTAARLADLHEQVSQSEPRLAEIGRQVAEREGDLVSEHEVSAAFADFENVWSALSPREQARVLQLLIAKVEYDAAGCSIEVSFHAAGIKALADDTGEPTEEAA